jgi:hypothetical protein
VATTPYGEPPTREGILDLRRRRGERRKEVVGWPSHRGRCRDVLSCSRIFGWELI